MSIGYGTSIVKNGLVYHLDAGNDKAYSSDGNLEVEYFIVAGGGGGTVHNTGGAGGGGITTGKTTVSGTNAIVVGAGGTWGNNTNNPTNGSNSTAFGKTALGGGRAGMWSHFSPSSGGSGAGGNAYGFVNASYTVGKSATQPTSTDGGFGNAGGDGSTDEGGQLGRSGGGGGGAGFPGKPAHHRSGGDGGDGLLCFIDRNYYGGGGGGAVRSYPHTSQGGLGGGGNGYGIGVSDGGLHQGGVNTGGGAGGRETGSSNGTGGGNGGSGTVLIRYKGPRKASGGDVIYEEKGYTIHKFNNSGNFIVDAGIVGDLSGNEHTGTLTNSPTFTTDNGGSFEFDGVDDFMVITDFGYPATWNDPFSVESWIYIPTGADWHNQDNGTTSNSGTVIVGRGSYAGSLGLARADTRCFVFIVRTNDGLYNRTFANANYDTWYHLVGTYDGTTSALYVNGSLHQSGPISGKSGVPDAGNWLIGGGIAFGGNNGRYGEGTIPVSRIYNRALTLEEVKQNFASSRKRFGV